MAKRRYPSLTEALKDILSSTELSLRKIEADTGVKRQTIAKFLRGEQSLRLDMADRLAAYFELTISRTNSLKRR